MNGIKFFFSFKFSQNKTPPPHNYIIGAANGTTDYTADDYNMYVDVGGRMK
jgi:hypothetical protein